MGNPAVSIEAIESFKAEIYAAIGCDLKTPPLSLTDNQTAVVLGNKTSTLAVWRSTGRYRLPFIKIGRSVRYRVSDLAEFMARRTAEHTGQGV
jgi:predicted DNA-binding transcriptional regulator AlpA